MTHNKNVDYCIIEGLKELMCNTNMISCRKLRIECNADISIELISGVNYKNCNKINVYIDFGRELDKESELNKAATLSIYLNRILEMNSFKDTICVKVIPSGHIDKRCNREYKMAINIYSGNISRKKYVKELNGN